MEQIERQRSALKDKHDDKITSLIALVPDEQKLSEPHLTWRDIASILSEGYQELDEPSVDESIADGYLKIMKELKGRIKAMFDY